MKLGQAYGYGGPFAALQEQPDPLKEALDAADELSISNPTAGAERFQAILTDSRDDDVALKVKEEAIYR